MSVSDLDVIGIYFTALKIYLNIFFISKQDEFLKGERPFEIKKIVNNFKIFAIYDTMYIFYFIFILYKTLV